MHKLLFFLFIFCFVSMFSFGQVKAIIKATNNKSYLKTKPNITFCGKTEGYVLLDSLLKAKNILMPDDMTLKSVSIYIGGGKGFLQPVIASTAGNSLSALAKMFKRCTEGTRIVFMNIKILKDKIIYDAPDMNFTVKEKL
jgi:hypothetical protein